VAGNNALREQYQARFAYAWWMKFQDNQTPYRRLLRLGSPGKTPSLMVVGDE